MRDITSRSEQKGQKGSGETSIISWADVAIVAAFAIGATAVLITGEYWIDSALETAASIVSNN